MGYFEHESSRSEKSFFPRSNNVCGKHTCAGRPRYVDNYSLAKQFLPLFISRRKDENSFVEFAEIILHVSIEIVTLKEFFSAFFAFEISFVFVFQPLVFSQIGVIAEGDAALGAHETFLVGYVDVIAMSEEAVAKCEHLTAILALVVLTAVGVKCEFVSPQSLKMAKRLTAFPMKNKIIKNAC